MGKGVPIGLRDGQGPCTESISSKSQLVWTDPGSDLQVWRREQPLGPEFRLCSAEGFEIDIRSDGSIAPTKVKSPFNESIANFIADQVRPRLLSHLGIQVLHGGAIKNLDKSVIFLGDTGRGKSTLVASFDGAGYSLMADDAVLIELTERTAKAKTLGPTLRLLPDSMKAVMPSGTRTTTVSSRTSKRSVVFERHEEHRDASSSISAIFILGQPTMNGSIQTRLMKKAHACMAVVANSFALDPTDRHQAAQRLAKAASLVDIVPVYSLMFPHDYASLPQVREEVLSVLAMNEAKVTSA